MEIVKEHDQPTGLLFGPAACAAIPESLATGECVGMSNTAYRTDVLRGISPSPPHCRLMDWFMATAGWIRGARFSFDNTPRMMYRQYGHNIARIILHLPQKHSPSHGPRSQPLQTYPVAHAYNV